MLKNMEVKLLCVSLCFLCLFHTSLEKDDEDEGPVVEPNLCEVCKYLVTELQYRLDETGKNKEIIRTGHGLDDKTKKKFKYTASELRLTEALQEPHICDRILEYNVHKERKGSLRFAKGMSETFQTLHGLVDKGVKVDLGIPYELWDTPGAEVTQLQRRCYTLVERYEDDIEEWYYNHQDKNLMEYLCRDLVLAKGDYNCIYEHYEPKGDTESSNDNSENETEQKEKKEKKKKKSKKGKEKLKGDPGDEELSNETEPQKDEL